MGRQVGHLFGRKVHRAVRRGERDGFPHRREGQHHRQQVRDARAAEVVEDEGGQVVFHWIWTGTNSGPGGTDKFVRIHGYEEWTMDPDGHILESKGHYDEGEYQRQLRTGASRTP